MNARTASTGISARCAWETAISVWSAGEDPGRFVLIAGGKEHSLPRSLDSCAEKEKPIYEQCDDRLYFRPGQNQEPSIRLSSVLTKDFQFSEVGSSSLGLLPLLA